MLTLSRPRRDRPTDPDALLAAGAQQPVQEHNAAVYYAEQDKGLAEPAKATLSPDLSPAMAQRLGIDRRRPLTVGEAANLMAGLTAQGDRVEGKRYRAAGVSLGEVFGISGAREQAGTTKVMRMLRREELAHALAGRRIDGTAIQLPSQTRPDRMTKKERAIVAGAQTRLRTALGLPAEGDPTQEHLQNIAARKRPVRCDCRQCTETGKAAPSLRRTASRCSAPANPSGGIFRRRTGNTAAAAHGSRPARQRSLVERSPEAASLRARSNRDSRYHQDLLTGRSLSDRCSGSGHHRRSQSTATPIASAFPQPAIDPTDRTPPCRHPPILWTLPMS